MRVVNEGTCRRKVVRGLVGDSFSASLLRFSRVVELEFVAFTRGVGLVAVDLGVSTRRISFLVVVEFSAGLDDG